MNNTTPPYALGTFSIAGATPFAGLILGQRRVISLRALQPQCRKLGHDLLLGATLLDVFDAWDKNQAAISHAANYLLQHGEGGLPFVDVALLRVHAPLEQPRQFFCSGANYRKHVIDLIIDQARDPATQGLSAAAARAYAEQLMDDRAAHGEPYIFTKAWSSITGPFDDIPLPANVSQPDWELELAVVIGKEAFHVAAADAYDYIAGYTIVNDITNRELVHRQDLKAIGSDWLMSKSLPGYTPMGPYIVPAELVSDPQNIRILLSVNGQVMQDETTADMIFGIPRLIEYLSSRIRLFPGDILITGSPAGNGSHHNRFLQAGDVLEGMLSGIGIMRNHCIAAV
ncbi:fumarylacetoacetate hydrolase family protein [Vogesella oryzagri]